MWRFEKYIEGGYQEEDPDIKRSVRNYKCLHDCAFVVFPLLLDA